MGRVGRYMGRDMYCTEGLEARYGVGFRVVDSFSRRCPMRKLYIDRNYVFYREYKNLQPTDDD